MSRYAQLFDVSIEHGYHLNFGSTPFDALQDNVREFLSTKYALDKVFTINPSTDTAKILAGHKMLFKNTSTGFLVAIELDPRAVGTAPLVPIDDGLQLRFSIELKDKEFLNYTSLPSLEGGLFHFSNRFGNAAPENYLSRAVLDYDVSKAYEAGELYLDTTALNEGLFQALRDTGPAASPVLADWVKIPGDTYDASVNYAAGSIVLADYGIYRALVDSPGTDLSDASDWEQLSRLANQHVTGEDYLFLHADRLSIDVSSAAIAQAFVSVFRLGESIAVWQDQFIASGANLETLPLLLPHLKPGAYSLEVRDNTDTVLSQFNTNFYVDAEALNRGWFAVIEIGLGSDSFALVDGSGELTNPSYFINFLSRATRWRYIFPQSQSLGTGAQVVQEDSEGLVLVTAEPHPLTRFGGGVFLQTDLPSTPSVSEEVVLPKPKVNRIRHQSSQWFSEIHLSNLPL